MMAPSGELHITEPGRPVRVVVLQGSTTIGRDRANDIVLESAGVSRHHAVLVREGPALMLIDLESANGTFVNGEPALPDELVRLADGDELRLGEVRARYVAPHAAGSPPDVLLPRATPLGR